MLLVKFTVFEVVQVTTERILRAVDISAFHQLSFWDSLIISTAEAPLFILSNLSTLLPEMSIQVLSVHHHQFPVV